MVKLIAIDLDDTLLNTKKDITNENKAAIKKALEKGIKIVIASGRPFFRVSQILKELVIDNEKNFVISYNGGYVSNGCNTVIIKKEFLNNNETIDIVNEINKYNLNFTIYIDDDIYTLGIKEEIREKLVFKGINFKKITPEEISKLAHVNKIIIADTEERIKECVEKIKADMSHKYNVVRSTPNFLEFLPKNANKGIALKALVEYLKLDEKEIAAIGDEENDLSMMEYAKYKIAMANANPILLEQATFITLDQEHSGVAKAIEYLLLTS